MLMNTNVGSFNFIVVG